MVVLTGESPPADRVAALESRAEVVRLPGPRPTPATVLGELDRRGAGVVLAEGGPTFNGQLVDADAVDELCLSLAPVLVGGGSSRIVSGSSDRTPTDLELRRLIEADGVLFARYVRRSAADTTRTASQPSGQRP